MSREEIDAFLKSIPAKLSDPLTKIRLLSGRELSAVLAMKHQRSELKWHALYLWSDGAPKPTMCVLI